tara:strand:+ start:6886 stop:7359 length:474 start_codon:yes stop_codon:yes gene_type:complete
MNTPEVHLPLKAPIFEDAKPKILIVVAPYYQNVTANLMVGAKTAITNSGATYEIAEVPGALEIPTAICIASRAAEFDGFVALGCVIRGETTHYETVCNDSSRALQMLGLKGLCIGNGILTVETLIQAEIRANPKDQNKGGGAAQAALHLVSLTRRFC